MVGRRCDGLPECFDGSDEEGCGKLVIPPANEVQGGYIEITLSVRLSVHLSVRPSVRPSVCPSVCLFVCLSVRLCRFVSGP